METTVHAASFEEVFQRLDDADTVSDLMSRIEFWISEKVYSDGVLADCTKVLEALKNQLKDAPEENHLAIARLARAAIRKSVAESTRLYCEEARKDWAPWRREFAEWKEAGSPANSRPPAYCFPLPAPVPLGTVEAPDGNTEAGEDEDI